MKRLLAAVLALIALTSCEKDELPIEPFDRGELTEASVEMGQGYARQLFYSLSGSESILQNDKDEWDLAFSADEKLVILNDARLMSAWKSPHQTLESAVDTTGFGAGKKVEVSAVMLENPALGDLSGVYLVDLGFNEFGASLGRFWIEVFYEAANRYSLRYKLFGSDEIKEALLEPQDGFLRYSLLNGGAIVSPPSADWDLLFTKFTHQFVDPPIAYLVTGVIINPNGTVAAEFLEKPFEEITAADTAAVVWSNRPDIIGYDWKYYSFDSGTYEVDTDRTWLIRNAEGFYYKFRFTDFYDENGQVGVPRFSYRLL